MRVLFRRSGELDSSSCGSQFGPYAAMESPLRLTVLVTAGRNKAFARQLGSKGTEMKETYFILGLACLIVRLCSELLRLAHWLAVVAGPAVNYRAR